MERNELRDEIFSLVSSCDVDPNDILSILAQVYMTTCAFYKIPLDSFIRVNDVLADNYENVLKRGHE